jgi:hypothetical protein
MARYVLIFDGKILPVTPDEKLSTGLGQRPLSNLRKALDSRKDWAAELGGCIGSVRENDIAIHRLVARS